MDINLGISGETLNALDKLANSLGVTTNQLMELYIKNNHILGVYLVCFFVVMTLSGIALLWLAKYLSNKQEMLQNITPRTQEVQAKLNIMENTDTIAFVVGILLLAAVILFAYKGPIQHLYCAEYLAAKEIMSDLYPFLMR